MINYTIFGQMIAFAVFVWFVMKYVWPPLIGAVNERQRKIEEGLNAANQAKNDLAQAEQQVNDELAAAKSQAAAIIDKANKTANQLVEDAKEQARQESARILANASEQADLQIAKAREALREQVADLVVFGAEKILQDRVGKQEHAAMLEQLAAKL